MGNYQWTVPVWRTDSSAGCAGADLNGRNLPSDPRKGWLGGERDGNFQRKCDFQPVELLQDTTCLCAPGTGDDSCETLLERAVSGLLFMGRLMNLAFYVAVVLSGDETTALWERMCCLA